MKEKNENWFWDEQDGVSQPEGELGKDAAFYKVEAVHFFKEEFLEKWEHRKVMPLWYGVSKEKFNIYIVVGDRGDYGGHAELAKKYGDIDYGGTLVLYGDGRMAHSPLSATFPHTPKNVVHAIEGIIADYLYAETGMRFFQSVK